MPDPTARIRALCPTIFLYLGVVLLAGCATSSNVSTVRVEPADRVVTEAETGLDQPSVLKQRSRLLAEVDRWKGTRYRYGGTGSRGFDCSGFVYRVFQDAYGISLPRTTRSQMKSGRPISNDDIRFADLVFFYTPSRTDHVGIYLGGGEFAHASSSSGVMISHLSEDYWRKAFRGARRATEIPFDEEPLPTSVAISEERIPQPAPDYPNALPAPSRIGW